MDGGGTDSSLPPRVIEALTELADLLDAELRIDVFRPPSGLVSIFGRRPASYVLTSYELTAADGTCLGEVLVTCPPDALADRRLRDVVAATVLPLLATCVELDDELLDAARRTVRSRLVAQTDALTGIGNRFAFDRAIDDLTGGPAAIVVIDLDGLKTVNDTLGHAAGDQLITAAAGALRSSARSDDLIARLGGDEFGLVLPRIGRGSTEAVVARLEAALTAAGVAASIGIAIADDGASARAALAAADADMYAHKTRRRATLPQPRHPLPAEHPAGVGKRTH